MTGMKQEFGYFLKNAKFRAALGLTLLLSYGYAIATTRVSIDSLEGDRYIGTGGTGVAADSNTIPAEHFTFSTMVLPSKCEGPLHLHDDVEEVFFMLKGQITLMIQDGDNYTETVLRERDLISVPPGIYRGLFYHGEEEALMCVMLGAKKPITPTYPPEHPLAKIKR